MYPARTRCLVFGFHREMMFSRYMLRHSIPNVTNKLPIQMLSSHRYVRFATENRTYTNGPKACRASYQAVNSTTPRWQFGRKYSSCYRLYHIQSRFNLYQRRMFSSNSGEKVESKVVGNAASKSSPRPIKQDDGSLLFYVKRDDLVRI